VLVVFAFGVAVGLTAALGVFLRPASGRKS
jgi:hypothetical protein